MKRINIIKDLEDKLEILSSCESIYLDGTALNEICSTIQNAICLIDIRNNTINALRGLVKRKSLMTKRYLHIIKLLEKDVQTVKSETIKEFADKYKFYVRKFESVSSVPLDAVLFLVDYVYEKMSYEMVGDDNA